ncbi:MAG: hypothetical protein Ct9H300mP5_4460 [Candidatus Pelagibacterales bacterium]|nr:MAG: hypothetical protein Ct9H300mP5_4460 [Pelagibacterales bacterium]
MADGIVTLAEKIYFFTGATLIFDHGHGISTLYMHLDEIFVEKNDIVKQGDIIGTVGSSGRFYRSSFRRKIKNGLELD